MSLLEYKVRPLLGSPVHQEEERSSLLHTLDAFLALSLLASDHILCFFSVVLASVSVLRALYQGTILPIELISLHQRST